MQCCDEPTEDCSNGYPASCNADCAGVLLPFFDDCREALILRGKTYRSMRDALLPLILEPSDERKGSMRERRAWDVADVLSRVLSRAAFLNGGAEIPIPAIVPPVPTEQQK